MTTDPAAGWTITCYICGNEDTMPWNPAMMRQDVARFLGIQPEEVILFCRECWPSVRSTTVDTLALINRVYPRKL